MKYTLIDNEIHIHQRDADTYWPLSIEEAQHVVDVMNAFETKSGEEKLAAIAVLVQDVQSVFPLKGTEPNG
jgi:rhodanese-related sulfurtransferase